MQDTSSPPREEVESCDTCDRSDLLLEELEICDCGEQICDDCSFDHERDCPYY